MLLQVKLGFCGCGTSQSDTVVPPAINDLESCDGFVEHTAFPAYFATVTEGVPEVSFVSASRQYFVSPEHLLSVIAVFGPMHLLIVKTNVIL